MTENGKTSEEVPLEILHQLKDAAEKLGINLPGVSRFAPTIDVTKPIRELAMELGRLLSPRNIFWYGDRVVTVCEKSGDIQAMTPKRFPSWSEDFCVFKAPGMRRIRDSLSVDDASQILETDIFKSCLRSLRAVHKMILPVRRESGEVSFLQPGWDEESQIFTVDLLPYEMDWKLGEGQKFLLEIYEEFPWLFPEGSEGRGLAFNRSFAVHILGLVGVYCRGLFPPGTLYPIIAYFANKPGTGKTRLAESVASPVFGFAAPTGFPKDDEKIDVKLETIAQSMQPLAIFDDIGRGLFSNSLNRFTSEAWHSGRRFHSNSEMFSVPNVTQIFVTANDIKTSEDIERRALIVELFLEDEVKGRKFKRVITSKWLSDPETRKRFLSACCAIVKHWVTTGMPVHESPIETYEEWSSVIGGIVKAAEFADPLQPPDRVVGGAADEDEIKQLLIVAASQQEGDCQISRSELIDIARENGLLEDLLGTSGEVDDATNKKLGRRMQRWRGQRLIDSKKRLFIFSHKKKKTGAVYPLTFVKPGTS